MSARKVSILLYNSKLKKFPICLFSTRGILGNKVSKTQHGGFKREAFLKESSAEVSQKGETYTLEFLEGTETS